MTAEVDKKLNVDVDAIVRLVLSELVNAGQSWPAADQRGASGETATARPADELAVSGRVVSAGDLEDRIGNIRRIVVQQGAVVTPSARDLLKAKNIALEFRNSSNNKQAQHRLVVGQADSDYEPAELTRALTVEAAAIEHLARTGLSGVVEEMCEQVSKGGQLGLLLTGRPAAALCLANRCRGVRAAVAGDAKQVERAVGEVGVNLLVIEPGKRSFVELLKMVREFLRGGERRCPESLQSQLG